MISKDDLVEHLFGFMQSVPSHWTRQELVQLYETGETKTQNSELSPAIPFFTLSVLELDFHENGEYIHVSISACDPDRDMKAIGGCQVPICTSFLWYKDGKMDMRSKDDIRKDLEDSAT